MPALPLPLPQRCLELHLAEPPLLPSGKFGPCPQGFDTLAAFVLLRPEGVAKLAARQRENLSSWPLNRRLVSYFEEVRPTPPLHSLRALAS